MKKSLIVIIIVILASCGKEDVDRVPTIPDYVGTYNNTTGDTAYVYETEIDGMINIRWCAMGNAAKINFDSTRILPDLTFTDNQLVEYFGLKTSIGSGSFGGNTLQFHFVVDGNGHIDFDGIKKTP